MVILHHIGYTVADIPTTAEQFSHFGYQAGPVLYDEALQVELCYLTLQGHETIELIHQLNPESLEAKLLSTNGVMPYHLAYEADDFDRTCRELDELGYRRLFDPVPVAALGGIRICYFHHPALGFVEILGK
jgi:methylmalonyl-CoA/ethylmalonyl-CoA epimerase